jgi:transcription initiation factor TFIIB
MSNTTKKIKKAFIDKKSMWDKFATEEDSEKNKTKIECIYTDNNKNKEQRELCECCQSHLFITDEGLTACSNVKCGILYKDIIDQSAEWRYYGADDNQSDDPTRCGMPVNPLLKESSFGCKVLCNGKTSYEMRKISRYTNWLSMPYREKSQYDEFQKITILANQSGIPKLIIDWAMIYHKRFSEAKTFRGLNRDGIIAASIYISSRMNNYPRTVKEIATIFHLDNTSATRGCKNAVSILNEMENEMSNEEKTSLSNTTPSSFIDRYCSRLNINNELTKLCKLIAIRIENNNLIPENTPHSIAAGIVYFVSTECNLNITKKAVFTISEISEVTINKCFKKLETMKDKLIPPKLAEKYK